MEFISFAEILTAVVVVLGSQKGYDLYKKKRNGGSNPGNSFSDNDKEFIKGCFNTHRLELVSELKDFIRDDGDSTREAVRGV